MNSLIQFLFSRPTEDGRYRMRFADLYHSYREFLAEEDIPNVKQNVYDEEKYLVAVLTESLLAVLSVLQGDKREFLLRRYLHTVVEQLRRPAYPENYPTDTLTSVVMGLFGHPTLFDVSGTKLIKESPLSLDPFPRFEDVQHYVGRIWAGDRHDQYMNSFSIAFYSFLLTVREEENASEFVYRYLSAMLQLELMPAGADSYDFPERTTYQIRF